MMKNGTELQAFTEETISFLNGRKVIDYYQEPLPSATDKKMGNICGRFMVLLPEARQYFLDGLTQTHRSLFGIYGHRAVTLSVRQESRQQLLSGLVGLAIANHIVPPRRNIETGFVVPHHCALKLNLDPAAIFAEAAQYASPDIARHMIAFGQRTDVYLSRYGWKELKTPEGVRYTFEF